MNGFLWQDTTTLRGIASVALTQTASAWCDLGDMEDLNIFIDVRNSTGSPIISFQTAPSMQDSSFFTIGSTTLAVGVSSLVLSSTYAAPARFVRWSLLSANNFDTTFRLWVAGYGWRR